MGCEHTRNNDPTQAWNAPGSRSHFAEYLPQFVILRLDRLYPRMTGNACSSDKIKIAAHPMVARFEFLGNISC